MNAGNIKTMLFSLGVLFIALPGIGMLSITVKTACIAISEYIPVTFIALYSIIASISIEVFFKSSRNAGGFMSRLLIQSRPVKYGVSSIAAIGAAWCLLMARSFWLESEPDGMLVHSLIFIAWISALALFAGFQLVSSIHRPGGASIKTGAHEPDGTARRMRFMRGGGEAPPDAGETPWE